MRLYKYFNNGEQNFMSKIIVFLAIFCFSCSISFADDSKWDAAKEKEYQDYIRKEEAKERIKEKEWEFVNRREKDKQDKEMKKYIDNERKKSAEKQEALRRKYADELHVSPNEIKQIIGDLSVFIRVEHNDGSNDICHKEYNNSNIRLTQFHCKNINTYADALHVLPADIKLIGFSETGIFSGKYYNTTYVDVLLKDNSISRCMLYTKPMICESDEIYSSSLAPLKSEHVSIYLFESRD